MEQTAGRSVKWNEKDYIVELSEEEADELMDEHWVGELVWCKDCKYIEHLSWLDDANGFKCYACRKYTFTGMRTPDWFCADEKRKEVHE